MLMFIQTMSVINLFSFADMWKYVALCCGNFLVVDMSTIASDSWSVCLCGFAMNVLKHQSHTKIQLLLNILSKILKLL